jgi:hypothetical protein
LVVFWAKIRGDVWAATWPSDEKSLVSHNQTSSESFADRPSNTVSLITFADQLSNVKRDFTSQPMDDKFY